MEPPLYPPAKCGIVKLLVLVVTYYVYEFLFEGSVIAGKHSITIV
jgi:hypothetical protein